MYWQNVQLCIRDRSASYIAAGTIEKEQVSSVSKALQGTVAGLQSFSSSGQPGSDATILTVSYTHLDVYKRQLLVCSANEKSVLAVRR